MPFAVGTRLGRIRIDAMLGAGGMGEVYRGFDERLERTVAIKRIHPDRRLTAAMRARFLREARVLSKLDHPNICRIYDVLEREEGDLLVLEFIEGTTLRDRVERGLPRTDAVAIALQIARVLAMAHGRDIIHRDLKPENVMVTAANEVKVLDFGLARLIGGDDAEEAAAVDFDVDDVQKTAVLDDPEKTTDVDSAQTTAGSLVGTVHYMSPEQARGLPLSPASDIYSLGAVLYEMLSGGASPYGELESGGQLLTRVRQGQVVPRDFGDAELTRLITSMLALHPTERPTAGEVVEALESIRTRPMRVRRRVIAAAAVLALLLAIGGSVVVARQMFGERKLFAKATGRVAVLPFRNATNDRSLAWVELGLTDLVARSLGDTRGVDVVPTVDVTKALRDLRVDRNVELSDDHRKRLLDVLGADVLIDAAVAAPGEGKYAIRYAAHGRDRTESPREVESTVVTEAAREVSLRLASRVGGQARGGAAQHYSLDHFANMAYAMGEQELGKRGPRFAVNYFAVAVDRDPGFDWARIKLADCYNSLGQIAESDKLIEETISRARAKRDDALLAAALIQKANWLADRGDSAAVGKYASEALAAAKRSGLGHWIVGAQNLLGVAAWRSGDLDRARRTYEEALRMPVPARDLRWQAKLHNNLGVLASERDDLAAARTHWEKARTAAERLNDRYLQTTILGNLGVLAGDSGDLTGAEKMTRRQIALAREIGDRETETLALTNLGLWLYAQGKEDEGIAVTEDALRLAKLMGAKRYYALIASNLAQVQTRAGRLEVARAHAEDAIKVVGEINDPQTAAETQVAYAYYLTRAGRLADAERALAVSEKHAPPLRHTVFKARLAYARGDYRRAAELMDKARAVDDTWLAAYEVMRAAFHDMARQGATKIAFESPIG